MKVIHRLAVQVNELSFIYYLLFSTSTEYCLRTTDPPLIFDTNDEHIMEASNEDQEGEELFRKIEQYLTEAKDIVAEQHSRRNYRFIQSVRRNFTGVQKFVDDIKRYSRRLTNPRMQDHTENTLFLE